jgi:hypothetical protein
MTPNELLQDAEQVIASILEAAVERKLNAAEATADAAAAVETIVKDAKAAIEAIPQIPAYAKLLLENDAMLHGVAANIEALAEKLITTVLDKARA